MRTIKKVIKDIILSVSALALMNGVLQFEVYPFLAKRMGADAFGNVLYVLGFVAIFAPAAGLAVNNTRLVTSKKIDANNADYLKSVGVLLLPCTAVFAVLVRDYFEGLIPHAVATLLMIVTALRNYLDVEYRLTLNFKGYFIYYAILSVGYLVGIIFYCVSQSYIVILLFGEVACIGFVLLNGTIYDKPTRCSGNGGIVLKSSALLFGSYLLYNAVLNLDRLFLLHLIDSKTVTVYFVASLIGKTFAILVGPLNSIIISYLSRGETKIVRMQFVALSGACLLLGLFFYLFTLVVAPIFIGYLYPDIFESAAAILWLANLSQIICFIGSLLLTVVLTLCSEKWQVLVQSLYAVLFVALAVILTGTHGLWGFVCAGLAANVFRLMLTFGIGLKFARCEERLE